MGESWDAQRKGLDDPANKLVTGQAEGAGLKSTESIPGYPDRWSFDVALRDGGMVRLRPIRPDDGEQLGLMVTRMSRESVYNRFFRAKDRLTPEEIEYFTHLDYRKRMAFVAVHEHQIIGVGRYDLPVDRAEAAAEVAFAVEDAHQNRGIGTHLLHKLADYAQDQDITGFKALVLADNHAIAQGVP